MVTARLGRLSADDPGTIGEIAHAIQRSCVLDVIRHASRYRYHALSTRQYWLLVLYLRLPSALQLDTTRIGRALCTTRHQLRHDLPSSDPHLHRHARLLGAITTHPAIRCRLLWLRIRRLQIQAHQRVCEPLRIHRRSMADHVCSTRMGNRAVPTLHDGPVRSKDIRVRFDGDDPVAFGNGRLELDQEGRSQGFE